MINCFDVAVISKYENNKNVCASQGSTGDELKPGESLNLVVNTGFVNGLSYGKPVGQLQKVVFRIEKIEMVDGTTWKRDKLKQ